MHVQFVLCQTAHSPIIVGITIMGIDVVPHNPCRSSSKQTILRAFAPNWSQVPALNSVNNTKLDAISERLCLL